MSDRARGGENLETSEGDMSANIPRYLPLYNSTLITSSVSMLRICDQQSSHSPDPPSTKILNILSSSSASPSVPTLPSRFLSRPYKLLLTARRSTRFTSLPDPRNSTERPTSGSRRRASCPGIGSPHRVVLSRGTDGERAGEERVAGQEKGRKGGMDWGEVGRSGIVIGAPYSRAVSPSESLSSDGSSAIAAAAWSSNSG